jgi:threonine/homoserine/homoserine lactone efflux protein
MEDPALFALAVLVILGTPGPTNSLLATGGATLGWRRALSLIPAEAAGYGISITVLGLLLGPVVAGQPLVATALRLLVGAYLLVLAVRLWRRGAPGWTGGALVRPRQVFVTTLLNPKALVFAFGVVPFGGAARLALHAGLLRDPGGGRAGLGAARRGARAGGRGLGAADRRAGRRRLRGPLAGEPDAALSA